MSDNPESGLPPQPTAYKHPIKEFCLECGAPLGDGNRFCWSCGAAKDGGRRRAPAGKRREEIAADNAAPSVPGEWNAMDALIGVGCGIIFLFFCPRLLQFVFHKLFGTSFAPFIDSQTGAVVGYTATTAFWSDLAVTAFALVMIVDGLLMCFMRRAVVVIVALGFTILTTAGNLLYFVLTLQQGIAMMSVIAVVFGIITAAHQWRMLPRKVPPLPSLAE